MRAILNFALIYLVLALIWVFYTPFLAWLAVRELANPAADVNGCEDTLKRAGAGATLALRYCLDSDSPPKARLRCARLLALQGQPEGKQQLLEMLRAYGCDTHNPIGAMAEAFILSVWAQHDAPPEPIRERLLHIELSPDPDVVKVITLTNALIKNSGWASGYARRARILLRNGEVLGARRDAFTALLLEPQNFDVMVTLSNILMRLNAPEQAYRCLEQAVRVNPRLKETQATEIRDARRGVEVEKARQRRERRKEILVSVKCCRVLNLPSRI
ncbi:MAG: hypothetical protein V1899_06605 [Planctomycetota bacterium]